MTRHTLLLLRREEQRAGEPSRNITDRLREYRQLTEALADYRDARGAEARADDFFAGLEERLRSGAVNLAPGAGPRPYLDAPEEHSE